MLDRRITSRASAYRALRGDGEGAGPADGQAFRDTGVTPGKTKVKKRRPELEKREKEPKPPGRRKERAREIKELQRALNTFTEKYLDSLPPLEVDGKKGT